MAGEVRRSLSLSLAHLARVEVADDSPRRVRLRPLQLDRHQRRVGRQPLLLLAPVAPAAAQDDQPVSADPLRLSPAAAARDELQVGGVSVVVEELQVLDQVPQ